MFIQVEIIFSSSIPFCPSHSLFHICMFQCGKLLPGLTKQEQCCGTIGTSWGFHKCQKCPNKPCKYSDFSLFTEVMPEFCLCSNLTEAKGPSLHRSGIHLGRWAGRQSNNPDPVFHNRLFDAINRLQHHDRQLSPAHK